MATSINAWTMARTEKTIISAIFKAMGESPKSSKNRAFLNIIIITKNKQINIYKLKK